MVARLGIQKNENPWCMILKIGNNFHHTLESFVVGCYLWRTSLPFKSRVFKNYLAT